MTCRLPFFAAMIFLLHAAGCVRLPQNVERHESFHLTDTADTRLAKTFASATAAQPNRTGLHPIPSGIDAFAARLALADSAERCLDVQYYIWDADDTGKLLAEHMMSAADRGVRVRMLLDDHGAEAHDSALLALDSHPNIEVRLFNPIALRGNDVFGMLMDFSRTNRRMHNKSFNADNQVAIVGGRNVGDEYFQSSSDADMVDLDAIAVGPVVQAVGNQFDTYWNSPASFPITSVSEAKSSTQETEKGRARLREHAEHMKQTAVGQVFAASPIVPQIESGDVSFYWGNATLIYDDPKKASAQSDDPAHRLLPRIKSITDRTEREVMLVSPYFIPGQAGIDYFRKLRERHVRVLILTNSMASTDVLPVYAAYSKYRKELLAMGVELYEFKPGAVAHVGSENEHSDDAHSASFAGLHAKVFAFDRTSMFVGSFNLDPRSQRLNTEVGVVFDSADMAADLSDRFESRLLTTAWHVEAVPVKGLFGPEVRLNWVTQDQGTPVRLTEEPGQGFWKNLKVGLMRMMPIESQL